MIYYFNIYLIQFFKVILKYESLPLRPKSLTSVILLQLLKFKV